MSQTIHTQIWSLYIFKCKERKLSLSCSMFSL